MKIGEILRQNQPKTYKMLRINKKKKKNQKKLTENDIKYLMSNSSYKRGAGGALKQVRFGGK